MGQLWKTILASLGLGVLVALVGLGFAALFGSWMSGLPWESAILLGMGVYSCLVMVVCTGVIVAKLKK